MPLEVRQIGIRLSVGGPEPADPAAAPSAPAGPTRLAPADRAAIVGDCVDAVLAALAARKER
jgi:hypothetical protein